MDRNAPDPAWRDAPCAVLRHLPVLQNVTLCRFRPSRPCSDLPAALSPSAFSISVREIAVAFGVRKINIQWETR